MEKLQSMIFRPFCRHPHFKINQICIDNAGSDLVSNSNQSGFYLYQINEEKHQSFGILGAIALNDAADFIYKHEIVNPDKGNAYANEFLKSATQLTPIMITTPNPITLPSFSDSNNSNILYKSHDHKHSLSLIEKNAHSVLSEQLSSINTIYILDGHHRISALQQLKADFALVMLITEQHINVGVMSRQLIFRHPRDKKKFLDAIMDHRLFNTSFFDGYVYNTEDHSIILSSFEGSFLMRSIKPKSNFILHTYVDNFISQHRHIIDKVEWFHQEDERCSSYYSGLHKNSVLIQLPAISYDQCSELFSQNKKVGLHTTCFYPKPKDGFLKFNLLEDGDRL